jgi:uncharacterized SAM-binding protein YcdF (DUF218 family)
MTNIPHEILPRLPRFRELLTISMKSRRKMIWRALSVCLLVLVAWPPAAWVAARALIVHANVLQADAIVVLAGSSTYVERAQQAAQLFQAGRAPRIVLTNDSIRSGWSVEEQRNPLFVERAVEQLRARNVPPEKIELVSGFVSSTYEEATRIRDFARDHNWHSILLVTSAYQSRRALWVFQRVFDGSGVSIGIDAAAPGLQSPPPTTWWFHSLGWKSVPGEYLKIIYYRINY